MPNQITDSFHLHPILPVAFGFDHTMVFPLPSDPPRPTSNLTGPIPDMLDRVDNDANEDRDPVSPAITMRENTVARSRQPSEASTSSRASTSAVIALLTSQNSVQYESGGEQGPVKALKRPRSKRADEKRYDVFQVKTSSVLKEAVTTRYVVLPHTNPVQEPEQIDDPVKFSLGDVYILKDISNPAKPTYRIWVCSAPNDPKGKSKACSRIWREVPVGENIPHPDTSIPLFFIFHEDTGRPSWVLSRTLQKYRQTAARRELADEFLAEFESPPKKRKV